MERGYETEVHTQRVGAVLFNRFVGSNHVALGLGHANPSPSEIFLRQHSCFLKGNQYAFFAHFQALAFARLAVRGHRQNLALILQCCKWLTNLNIAGVEQDLRPESGVQQVHNRMLGSADIAVNRHPIINFLRVPGVLKVVGIAEAQEVPR